MKSFAIALGILAALSVPLFGAKTLKKSLFGTNCGTTDHNFNPAWSFASPPSSSFYMKWGVNSAIPGTTGVWPNEMYVAFINDAAVTNPPQWMFYTCICYLSPTFSVAQYPISNANGNVKVGPFDDQIILNYTAYGQLAVQIFGEHTDNGGITYSHIASEVCTIYDASGSAYYP